MNRKKIKTVCLIVIACIIWLLLIAGVLFLFLLRPEQEKVTDIERYETILGKNGKYKNNFLGYNSIFPDTMPESAEVKAFYYEYYNPWDPNYLGYLVYTCDEEAYEKERKRLQELEDALDFRVYGTTEFPYELCAVTADEYYGIRYALADKEKRQFIYVELAFCNYFTDIQYENIVEKKYLPLGFDASKENPTREKFQMERK